MQRADSPPNWFALRVKPNAEKAIAGALRRAGVEEYLPLVQRRQKWSDRWKLVEFPLFSGYVFCRTSFQCPYRVVSTPGVVGFVGFGGTPAAIPEWQIETVRRLIASGRRLWPMALLREGQRVAIQSGPLEGLEGILKKIKNDRQLVVGVELLNRSVAVTLDGDAVAPLCQKTSSRTRN